MDLEYCCLCCVQVDLEDNCHLHMKYTRDLELLAKLLCSRIIVYDLYELPGSAQ